MNHTRIKFGCPQIASDIRTKLGQMDFRPIRHSGIGITITPCFRISPYCCKEAGTPGKTDQLDKTFGPCFSQGNFRHLFFHNNPRNVKPVKLLPTQTWLRDQYAGASHRKSTRYREHFEGWVDNFFLSHCFSVLLLIIMSLSKVFFSSFHWIFFSLLLHYA